MCSVSKQPSHSCCALLFYTTLCIQPREQKDNASLRKRQSIQESSVTWGETSLWMYSLLPSRKKHSLHQTFMGELNINTSFSEPITNGWKWGLRKIYPSPSQTVFDGLIKLAGAGPAWQRDLHFWRVNVYREGCQGFQTRHTWAPHSLHV